MPGRRSGPPRFPRDEPGAREAFEDAALYDHEYRRRRDDVAFYREIARERCGLGDGGSVLDLACGTGRLLVPLVRDGHTVIGIDRSPPMLARAAARIARLPAAARRRALLLRADLRAFALRRPGSVALAVCAFHSVQHLLRAAELLRFFRNVRRCLRPDGWFAFDVLPAHPGWLGRDPERRWSRTRLAHPVTGQRLVYTTNHRYAARTRVLHMHLHYQPVDARGAPCGAERTLRMDARQLAPEEVARLLARAGLRILARYADFSLAAHDRNLPFDEHSREHVYLARPHTPRRGSRRESA